MMCTKKKKISDTFVGSLCTGHVDGDLIPASALTQAAISLFLGEEGFCYLSNTSLIIPSEGQTLPFQVLHSMHPDSEESVE